MTEARVRAVRHLGREEFVRQAPQPLASVHAVLGEGEQQRGQGDGGRRIAQAVQVLPELPDQQVGVGQDAAVRDASVCAGALGPESQHVARERRRRGLRRDHEADAEQQLLLECHQGGCGEMREVGRREWLALVGFGCDDNGCGCRQADRGHVAVAVKPIPSVQHTRDVSIKYLNAAVTCFR
jgi:hypothetical protein